VLRVMARRAFVRGELQEMRGIGATPARDP
jgi:hypothetical protein